MKVKKRRSRWMLLGALFLTAALGLSVYNIWDARRAEQSVDEILSQMKIELPEKAGEADAWTAPNADFLTNLEMASEIEIPNYLLNPDMEMPVMEVDGRSYIGVLEIPVLALSLPVISEWSYPDLRIAPCRYEGSAYKEHLVIAAHNYESHFGTLKYLENGDPVIFTDVDGNVFQYEVAARETIMPTDIEGMTGGEWDLTLFTCTYGGQQRVAVRCERIQNSTLPY